jgi:hypothetical protein
MVRTRGVNVEFGVVTVAPLAVTAVTVTAAVPVFVSPPDTIEAVIVAEPAATPVTRPLPLTVATLALLDVHVAAGSPAIAVPFWSSAEALSCAVAPTLKLGVAGVTATDVNIGAGGGGGGDAPPVTTTWPVIPACHVHS